MTTEAETTDLPVVKGKRKVGTEIEHAVQFAAAMFYPLCLFLLFVGAVGSLVVMQEAFQDARDFGDVCHVDIATAFIVGRKTGGWMMFHKWIWIML